MINYRSAWVAFESGNNMSLDMFVRPTMPLLTLMKVSNICLQPYICKSLNSKTGESCNDWSYLEKFSNTFLAESGWGVR